MEKQRWIYQQDSAVSNGNVSNFLRPSPLHSSLATLLSRVVALLLASSQIVTSQLAFLSKLDLPLPGLSLSLLYRPREIPIKEPRTFGKKKKRKKRKKNALFFFQRGSSLSEILYSPPISFSFPSLPFFSFLFLFSSASRTLFYAHFFFLTINR